MTQSPSLSYPVVKPNTFEFNCHVNFNTTRTDVGFDIEWLFDGVPDRNISRRRISGAQRDSSIDQKYLVGHLGQAVSCLDFFVKLHCQPESTTVVVCLGLTSLSTIFSHITTVSGCDRELNAHFYSAPH